MNVNLDTLALEASDTFGMTKKDARVHIVALMDLIAENIADGHDVTIPSFGKFRRKDRQARKGRNPRTGEETEIAAKSVPNFLPSKKLKELCKERGIS